MSRSSEIAKAAKGARALLERARRNKAVRREPRTLVRIVLGTLLVLNLAAAIVAFKPFGGSPEDLERQKQDLQRQVALRQAGLTRAKALAAKMALARKQGDGFLGEHILNRRTASVSIISELNAMAKQAGIKPKGESFSFEAIDGSDTLSMMTVAAGYEGPYPSLTRFINALDRSPRFLIVESLQASPQQGGATLNTLIKFNAFVSDGMGRALARAVNHAPQPAEEHPQKAEPAAAVALPSAPPAAAAPPVAVQPAPVALPPGMPQQQRTSEAPEPPPAPARGEDPQERRPRRPVWSPGGPLPINPSMRGPTQ